jgi:hypothetical protein
LAEDDDIRDVKREFKCTFYSTKQSKNESLFDFAERVIALQERDLAICVNDPDYDSSDPVPIIPEDEYAAMFIERLNEANGDIRADYLSQRRLRTVSRFSNLQEARDFADKFERTKHIIDTKEDAVSRQEFTILKTTLKAAIDGNSDEAKVLLTGKKPGKRGKGSSASSGKAADVKPTRECKHCQSLKIPGNRMHWDKECPMMAYFSNYLKNLEGKDGKRDDSSKVASKKRKKGEKRNVKFDDDDTEENDDSDNESESEDDVPLIARDRKRSKGNKK